MKRNTSAIFAAFFFLGFTGNALALDGERQGFMIDFGIGGGGVSVSTTVLGTSFSSSEGGAGATFNIGYGFSNQFALYLAGKSNAWSNGSTQTFSVGGVGATYYFAESAPSAYIDAVIGRAEWDDGSAKESGMGFGIGAGYEFKKNWSFNIDFTYGSIDFGGIDARFKGVMVKFNHHWY